MNSMEPEGRDKVKVKDSTAKELKNKLEQFKNYFQIEQNNFDTSKDVQYYLVSTRYLRQWQQFCSSKQVERYKPKQINEDIVDEKGQLKKGLTEKDDFQILNKKLYELVRNGDCKNEVKRKSVMKEKKKKIPIYLDSIIHYVKISQKDLKESNEEWVMKQIKIWGEDFCESLIEKIKQAQQIGKNRKVRLWRNNKNSSSKSEWSSEPKPPSPKEIWRQFKSQAKREGKILGKGIIHQDLEQTISDMRLTDGEYFIVEVVDENKNWFLSEAKRGKCQSCYSIQILNVICKCKSVAYCNQSCQQKDKRWHIRNCKYLQQQQINKPINMEMTEQSRRGKVGLSNLGNTCFMNSCLQCLSNTVQLTQYFLLKYYEKEMNINNPLGTNGKVAKCYAEFIKNMWCGTYDSYSPYQLKSAVGAKNQIFMGFAQHDSHQFFSSIVDYIHEDLNRVIKKPFVDQVSSNGRDDRIVALESWIGYSRRNQSIVADLMTGQYKSKVVCPDSNCKLQSITFDPFTTVSLPLPKQCQTFNYFVIYQNCHKSAEEMKIFYRKPNGTQFLKSATESLNRKPSQFVFYILTESEDIYSFKSTPISEILEKMDGQKAFLLELTEQEQKIKDKFQIVTKFCKGDQNLWLKRPFFFEKNASILTIRKRLLQQLQPIYRQNMNDQSGMFQKSNGQITKKMLEKNFFTLVLKYNKSKQTRYYGKEYTKFGNQIVLSDDTVHISEIIEKLRLQDGDYELDVRFQFQIIKFFAFDKWRTYTTKYEKWSKHDDGKDEKPVPLSWCFEEFQQPEKLEHGNEWYCPKCKKHQLAIKQMSIYKIPQILILHLKRFKIKTKYHRQKNPRQIDFPLILDMKNYVVDKLPLSSYTEELKKQQVFIKPPYQSQPGSSSLLYQLYAISNHYGSLGGGHYTAYAKNNNKWFEFNDSSVRSINQKQIQSSAAYLLFYKRKND